MTSSSKQLFNETSEALQAVYDREEASSIAFLLLAQLFKINKAAVLADKLVPPINDQDWQLLIERLKNHEPIQYVLGETEFYGHWFKVNSHVLIPRPETEELVDWIVTENKNLPKLKILDIGTGSGCIAISLAAALPSAEVLALDISAEALEIARYNSEKNGVAIQLIQANILDTQPGDPSWQLDRVVSNPPYVTYAEKELMRKNVMDYEPHLALFVPNEDPLLFYRKIGEFCLTHLNKNGRCYFEVNEQYGTHVKNILLELGFSQSEVKKDIFGKDRFVKGIY